MSTDDLFADIRKCLDATGVRFSCRSGREAGLVIAGPAGEPTLLIDATQLHDCFAVDVSRLATAVNGRRGRQEVEAAGFTVYPSPYMYRWDLACLVADIRDRLTRC